MSEKGVKKLDGKVGRGKKEREGNWRRKEEIEGRKNEIGKGRKNGREENMNR